MELFLKRKPWKRKNLLERKGQAEIIGLAILVILLVFILIVALSFSYKSSDKDDIRVSLIGNNLLNALIKEQGKINIKELIYNCYNSVKKGLLNDANCQSLDKEINKVVSLSLSKRDYFIRFRTEEIEFFKKGNCDTGIESVAYRFKKEGVVFIGNIRIC